MRTDLNWDYEPNIGASTAEPSIREIIFKYYMAHFSRDEALALTDKYLGAFEAACDVLTYDDVYHGNYP